MRESIRDQAEAAHESLKETAAVLESIAVEVAETGKYKASKVQDKIDESMDKIKETISPRESDTTGD